MEITKTILTAFIGLFTVFSSFANFKHRSQFICEVNPKIEFRTTVDNKDNETLTDSIMREAESHKGKKYVWATRGPKTFDCSGFVYYVFKQFDIILSPSSRNQYTLGEHVNRNDAMPGDLIFFHSRKHPKGVGHVGIVWENSDEGIKFIHASCSQGVTISHLSGYYERNFVGIKRVLD